MINEEVSVPELPKKIKVLLAREVESESEKSNAVPLSVYKKGTWKPAKHNILGDWEDYEEIQKLHGLKEVQAEEITVEEKVTEEPKEAIPEFNELQEKQRLEEEKRKEWLSKLAIFQRYKEVREEHALDNWKRHSVEWAKVENQIAKRAGRSPEDLLMARLGEYRQKVESKQLIEEAMLLLEEQNINFWKEGLRIGNELLGLSIQLPRGGPRPIERLYFNEKSTKKSKDGEYLELIGQGVGKVGKQLTEAFLERLEKIEEQKEETKADDTVDVPLELSPEQGMKLVGSTNRLFYEVKTGQISTTVMTLYNQGTVAVHFEWVPVKRKNPLNTKQSHDGRKRFFLNYMKGVIRPGTAFDFPVVFQSSTTGIYTETWRLVTSPVSPPDQEICVTLHGIAYEPDLLREKREEIDKLLLKRRAESEANETMKHVLKRLHSAQLRLDTPPKDLRKRRFEERNKMLQLHYHPVVYDQLLQLATSIYDQLQSKEEWNGSVITLSNMIAQISDNSIKAEYLAKLNHLVNESTQDPISGHNLMCVISGEILTNLAYKLVDVSEDIRKKLNLPAKSHSFQDQDEQVEEVDNDALKLLDKKNIAMDPKKAGKTPDPKAKAAQPPKPDPKKKENVKPVNEEENPSAPKKKKPHSSKGWSAERKAIEQKYASILYDTMRKHVYDGIGRMTALFGDSI